MAVPDCWKARSISSSVSPGGRRAKDTGEDLAGIHTAASLPLQEGLTATECLAFKSAACSISDSREPLSAAI